MLPLFLRWENWIQEGYVKEFKVKQLIIDNPEMMIYNSWHLIWSFKLQSNDNLVYILNKEDFFHIKEM